MALIISYNLERSKKTFTDDEANHPPSTQACFEPLTSTRWHQQTVSDLATNQPYKHVINIRHGGESNHKEGDVLNNMKAYFLQVKLHHKSCCNKILKKCLKTRVRFNINSCKCTLLSQILIYNISVLCVI